MEGQANGHLAMDLPFHIREFDSLTVIARYFRLSWRHYRDSTDTITPADFSFIC